MRYEVGAGIEKKQEDFAEEVRKQVESMQVATATARTSLIRELDKNPAPAGFFIMAAARLYGLRAADLMTASPAASIDGLAAVRTRGTGLRRILLKLSGEALMGEEDYGIDPKMLKRVAMEIREVMSLGMQVAVVIGGGNIFRGAGLARAGMDRVTGDHMGMLATVMNSLALQDAVEALGMYARVMSAIRINEVCEEYIRRRAVRHLEKGRVTHSRRRHRQSVLHDRYGRQPARDRDQRRPAAQGDQGERHLFRRSDEESGRDALHAPDVRQGADGSSQRDGRDRDRHVPRQQPAAARVRSDHARRVAAHRARRGRRHAGYELELE